jgi:hypothetical protein
MGKRFWAAWIKRMLLSLAVIFIAGVIFDRIVNVPMYRSPLVAGFLALAAYIAVLLVIGFLDLISGALYLWLFGGNDLTAGILDELREAKLPAPRSYDPKNYDYLAILADDESAEPADRVKAAVMVGAYSTLMRNGIFRALAIRKALDEAVLRYSQEAPQRAEPSC